MGAHGWAVHTADLVARYGNNRSAFARAVGVSPQRVSQWLKGEVPSVRHVRAVARATDYSLPYLLAVAYDIPMAEFAAAVGDLIASDPLLDAQARAALAAQYQMLRELSQRRGHSPT
jgi:transcriptional regulator with XRE-family HTH domain